MTIPGSFTLLKTFDQCPRQAHHRYVLKDIPFEESDASRWGSRVHKAMEDWLTKQAPLPEGMGIYESFLRALKGASAEMKLAVRRDWSPCDFFAKDVWLRGKADVVHMQGSAAVIVDWKTGKVREDPDELEILGEMLKAKHPEITMLAGWYVWLKDLRLGKVHHLNADARPGIERRMNKFEDSLRVNHWPPNETPLCGWCSVKTCEFHP